MLERICNMSAPFIPYSILVETAYEMEKKEGEEKKNKFKKEEEERGKEGKKKCQ